jgi:type IV pilus assembly protein PilX
MALAMSLIFLLLLTILAITAIGTGALQEKMAGNLRDQDVALQAAESALRGGENRINDLGASGRPIPDNSGSSGIWTILSLNDQILNDTWWRANSILHGGSVQLAYENPRFVIEELEFVEDSLVTGGSYGARPGIYYYRVTSRAVGATPFSQAVLQSTYRARYN